MNYYKRLVDYSKLFLNRLHHGTDEERKDIIESITTTSRRAMLAHVINDSNESDSNNMLKLLYTLRSRVSGMILMATKIIPAYINYDIVEGLVILEAELTWYISVIDGMCVLTCAYPNKDCVSHMIYHINSGLIGVV